MRHATDQDLDGIEPLLQAIRALPGLTERRRGIFYWKSRAFLHFHEHEGELYADVRLGPGDFERLPLSSTKDRQRLVKQIQQCILMKTKPDRSR